MLLMRCEMPHRWTRQAAVGGDPALENGEAGRPVVFSALVVLLSRIQAGSTGVCSGGYSGGRTPSLSSHGLVVQDEPIDSRNGRRGVEDDACTLRHGWRSFVLVCFSLDHPSSLPSWTCRLSKCGIPSLTKRAMLR